MRKLPCLYCLPLLYPICGWLLAFCLLHTYSIIPAIGALCCVTFLFTSRDTSSCIANGLTFSIAFYFTVFYWMGMVLGGTLAPMWFAISIVSAISQTAFVALVRKILEGKTVSPPLFASIWTSFECLRHLGTRVFEGNGSTMLVVGQLLADFPVFAQTADLLGAWGLSWMVALSSGLLFSWITNRDSAQTFHSTVRVVVLWAAVFAYGVYRTSHDGYGERVNACIAPFHVSGIYLGPRPKHTTLEDAIGKIQEGMAGNKADIVVWPESAFRWDSDEKRKFAELTEHSDTLHVLGITRYDEYGLRNAVVMTQHGKEVYSAEKRHLVPFVECLPPGGRLLLNANLLPSVFCKRPCTNKPSAERFLGFAHDGYDIVPFVCYDVFFSDPIQLSSAKHSAVLCGSLAESVDESSAVQKMSIRHCQLRAIENRAPLVRCSQGSVSAFVSSNGSIVDRSNEHEVALFSDVRLDNRSSIYSRIGENRIIVAFLFVAAFAVKMPNPRESDRQN